jgi:hypothetical protein
VQVSEWKKKLEGASGIFAGGGSVASGLKAIFLATVKINPRVCGARRCSNRKKMRCEVPSRRRPPETGIVFEVRLKAMRMWLRARSLPSTRFFGSEFLEIILF